MAKRRVGMLYLLAVWIVLAAGTSGCTKCACCGPWIGAIQCVKGTDTVIRELSPYPQPGILILDSLAFYRGRGYTCTIPGIGTQLVPFTEGGRTCGEDALKQAEAMGYGCVADYTKPDNEPCHR